MKLYRCREYTTTTPSWNSGTEEYGPPYYYNTQLKIKEYEVVRETEHSYFILIDFRDRLKRVPKKGMNLYAHATKEKAVENFFYKKVKQIKILNHRLEQATSYRNEAKQLLTNLLKENNETI